MRIDGGPRTLSRRALIRRGMLIGLAGSGLAALGMACSTARQNTNSQVLDPVTPVTSRPGWVINATPGAELTGKPIGSPVASPTK